MGPGRAPCPSGRGRTGGAIAEATCPDATGIQAYLTECVARALDEAEEVMSTALAHGRMGGGAGWRAGP